MSTTAAPIARLTVAFSRLPGIGPKSAQRLAYYVLQSSDVEVEELAESLLCLKNSLVLCSRCFNVADKDPCSICSDPQRDKTVVCVVEKPSDIPPMERTSQFNGLYHVLHGVVSPNKGIGPDDLKIRELLPRLRDGEVKEVVLATNPTVEGEATAMYIRQLVTPMGVKATKLARGLPYGSDLEYADDITLGRAINSRQGF